MAHYLFVRKSPLSLPSLASANRIFAAVLFVLLNAGNAILLAAPPIPGSAETAPEKALPIPFSEIGAKASAEYKGDAIGIRVTAEGAELRTGFQKLEGRITKTGLQLTSTDTGAGSLKLTADALGRTGIPAVALPKTGDISVEGQTVRFTRPGLTEEFSVSADGLRQDFIVARAPAGEGELIVELTLTGATARNVAEGIVLTLDGSRRELAYSRLKVTDAQNQPLQATLTAFSPTRLAVRVQDAGAVYPVRIDPTFSDADWDNTMNYSSPGTNGTVYASVVDGSGNLYIGGEFTIAGGITTGGIAKWNGSVWSALGEGVTQKSSWPRGVYCLAVIGTHVYAGGDFVEAGGVAGTANIAKWDGSTWSALGSGVNGTVRSLAVIGSELYAGGFFGSAGGVAVNCIAKWNGIHWTALGSGVAGEVLALAVAGTDLYAGGSFSKAGGVATGSVAKWNGNAWSALGSGVWASVYALAASGTNLYAAGSFDRTGEGVANRIAKWNGSSWSPLGSGLSGRVYAVALRGTDLYAAGEYAIEGGVAAPHIAKWNGSEWSGLGSGPNSVVRTLAVHGPDLYVGGAFPTSGGVPGTSCIAKWNESGWLALGSGINGIVAALAVSGSDLYAGGNFTTAGGVAANGVAKWNGSEWSALGTGLTRSRYAPSGIVFALAASGSDVYAAGDFTTAGGKSVGYIAKWNGSEWSALGGGFNWCVYALALRGTELFAAGGFTGPFSYIAKWNGSTWVGLGSGMNSSVSALTLIGPDLYAGGDFTMAGGSPASRIAKWKDGEWSALGSGMNGSVRDLAAIGTVLYAGGEFTTAGGAEARYVAKWTVSGWSPLGSGTSWLVRALATSGTDLYVGGDFTKAGGIPASRIARWNGSNWFSLGSGVDSGGVGALTFGANGQLVLGGSFNLAGTTTVAPYIVQANVAPNPEIGVSGNGQDIANADATPDPADGTSYGSAILTGGLETRIFRITNGGTTPLKLTQSSPDYVTLSGSSAFNVTVQPAAGTIPAAGSTQTFAVTFEPATLGQHTATVSIASSDEDENPFTFTLSGQGVTPAQLFNETMTSNGLTGSATAPDAAPRGDGVVNLLKYSFNLDLRNSDRRELVPGTGTAGLPSITATPGGIMRVEFLRRIGSGLIYTPQQSADLSAETWASLTDTPSVTPVDALWERAVYEEPMTAGSRGFVRVSVGFAP